MGHEVAGIIYGPDIHGAAPRQQGLAAGQDRGQGEDKVAHGIDIAQGGTHLEDIGAREAGVIRINLDRGNVRGGAIVADRADNGRIRRVAGKSASGAKAGVAQPQTGEGGRLRIDEGCLNPHIVDADDQFAEVIHFRNAQAQRPGPG